MSHITIPGNKPVICPKCSKRPVPQAIKHCKPPIHTYFCPECELEIWQKAIRDPVRDENESRMRAYLERKNTAQ